MLYGQNTSNLKFFNSMNLLYKKVGGDDNIDHPPLPKKWGGYIPQIPLKSTPMHDQWITCSPYSHILTTPKCVQIHKMFQNVRIFNVVCET